MYIFGGYDGRDGNYFNDVHSFDFETQEWELVRVSQPVGGAMIMPKPRTDHCLVCHDDSLYVFGGYDGTSRYNDTFAFNLKTRQWSQKNVDQDPSEKPSRRFGHSGVVHNGKLWVFGGWDGRETLNCVWALDLKTEVWTSLDTMKTQLYESILQPSIGNEENSGNTCGNMCADSKPLVPSGDKKDCFVPRNRYRHSAVSYENHMLVFGGIDKDHHRFNDLLKFSYDTLKWEPFEVDGVQPTSRTFHRAVTVENSMYIFGGYDGSDRLNDLYSIYVGRLSPPTLEELAATYIRKNVSKLSKMGKLDTIPEFVIDSLIWTRDDNGDLRGGRTEGGRELCKRLALTKGRSYSTPSPVRKAKRKFQQENEDCSPGVWCAQCGGSAMEHELVREQEFVISGQKWQPDTELSSQDIVALEDSSKCVHRKSPLKENTAVTNQGTGLQQGEKKTSNREKIIRQLNRFKFYNSS
eukprot:CAMPEP_0203781450 /NCGR_PEP_ID=MMETSP0099_2-20121227/10244_1 /ASSEMBLY_ACC=CAM_ASM_000209 /TAXON_ID=96639 /ORGANISM=" , Strain NY0313808BC1" /LENGTH=464 /DNA_ID=CAMNT_0050682441 /DNA_START=423 /DNA_END=1820 /DNA_ORIENTATION=+